MDVENREQLASNLQGRILLIVANGNSSIGAGHIMRCSAIAEAYSHLGGNVCFAVADNASAELVRRCGRWSYVITGGDPIILGASDGLTVVGIANQLGAGTVLIDSYAVSDSFFSVVSQSKKTVYIDDAYSFECGSRSVIRKWEVSTIINYGFSFSSLDYDEAYYGTGTEQLIGPAYAPIRSSFQRCRHNPANTVERILVMSGSTNPESALERMVSGCKKAVGESVAIDVVVGKMADYYGAPSKKQHIDIHRGLADLSALMQSADIAISAAGSTLYELACVGVPTVALPIVDNQVRNAKGFTDSGLGFSVSSTDWSDDDVAILMKRLVNNASLRLDLSNKMRRVVDGHGAKRIARLLLREQY